MPLSSHWPSNELPHPIWSFHMYWLSLPPCLSFALPGPWSSTPDPPSPPKAWTLLHMAASPPASCLRGSPATFSQLPLSLLHRMAGEGDVLLIASKKDLHRTLVSKPGLSITMTSEIKLSRGARLYGLNLLWMRRVLGLEQGHLVGDGVERRPSLLCLGPSE